MINKTHTLQNYFSFQSLKYESKLCSNMCGNLVIKKPVLPSRTRKCKHDFSQLQSQYIIDSLKA